MTEIVSKDVCTIVVVGNWNIAIFTPQWVKANLFSEVPEIQLEYPQNIVGNSMRFTAGNLSLNISMNRLQICINEDSDITRMAAVELLRKINRLLVHTPIFTMGINFRFTDDNESSFTSEPAALSDVLLGPLENKSTKQTFKLGENEKLNIEKTLTATGITYDFNYSYKCTGVGALSKILGDDSDLVVKKHNQTKDVLSNF